MGSEKYSSKEIQLIHDAFNAQAISKQAWTHECHLLVALSFASLYEEYEALCRIRSGIILLNNVHGTVNDAKGGYHETLTCFYSKLVRLFAEINQGSDIGVIATEFFSSSLAQRSLPLRFYDKEKLFSPLYRALYITPEKLTLDHSTIEELVKNSEKF